MARRPTNEERGARLGVLLFAWLLATLAAAAEPTSTPAMKPDAPVVPGERSSIESNLEEKSKPAQPPLDLAALEQRLKETAAIGVFTKLTLKNQVDDLLDRFRAFYEGRIGMQLADLRQPYDLLLLKTVALVQDGDPALAEAIAFSREAIWEILADPDKFAALATGV
ncbi:MAG: hypothetical protein ACREUX_12700 [Burkholderiales bacterium]